jgi:phytoene synthase
LPERDPVLAGSRAAIGAGSRSFAVAARLFDRRTRDAVHLLYSWCRYCDDQIDSQDLGHGGAQSPGAGARLERLRAQTRDALAGKPGQQPEFAALQRVVALYHIPQRYPFELLDGFAMDVALQRFETLDDTLRYCYHVAGVVGLMLAHVLGARSLEALRHAADLGLALQMTNIARDVVPDARVGRVYLPRAWLREAGLDPARLAEPAARESLARLVARLLREAQPYYASADRGLVLLDFRAAWAVAAARGVYSEIGRLVEARGARAWDQRAVVPRPRQLLWIARAFFSALGRRRRGAEATEARTPLWTERLPLD